jgi:hypothetical protein
LINRRSMILAFWMFELAVEQQRNKRATLIDSVSSNYPQNVGESHLFVVKSDFNRACIGLFKQLLSKSEKIFVRTHWL